MKNLDDIRQILNRAHHSQLFSACAMVAFDRNGIRHSETLGTSQFGDSGVAINSDTLFDLASLTKVLAMTFPLVESTQRDQMDLEQTLGDVFPHWPETIRRLSILDLLRHSSGLPALWPIRPNKNRTAMFDAYAHDLGLHAQLYSAGEKTIYSDVGYILLAAFVEKVTGQGLDQWFNRFAKVVLKENHSSLIGFRPVDLEMNCYNIVATELKPSRSNEPLCGIVHDDNAYAMNGISAHAGLFASGRAVALLAAEWMQGYDGKSSLFSEDLVHWFSTPSLTLDGVRRARGFDCPTGFDSASGLDENHSAIGHWGYTGTSLWMDLPLGHGVVLLANRVHPKDQHTQEFKFFRTELHRAVWDYLKE